MGEPLVDVECGNFSTTFTYAIQLQSREVHVIRANLRASSSAGARSLTWLSSDERDRAARYRFEEHRRRFIAGRVFLRTILGAYLGIAPGEVRFSYGSHGKPSLDKNVHIANIQFNVSASEELALYAVAQDVPLGVDVERVSPRSGFDSIARRICSPAEYQKLADLPDAEKIEAFFHCWTRKEALAKAIGEGLLFPMDQYDVSTGGRVSSGLPGGNSANEAEWFLHDLSPAEGFVGALVVGLDAQTIRGFLYPELD